MGGQIDGGPGPDSVNAWAGPFRAGPKGPADSKEQVRTKRTNPKIIVAFFKVFGPWCPWTALVIG